MAENDIGEVPQGFFAPFNRLMWLNLDNNHIRQVPTRSLPASLITLSVQNNHVSKFPADVILEELPSLTWCILRGNYIESIPSAAVTSGGTFTRAKGPDGVASRGSSPSRPLRLDKLDLGENFITAIRPDMLGGRVVVKDLHLDHNYIEALGEGALVSVLPRRVYLGANRISQVHQGAFAGVEDTLEVLDLDGNRLNEVPQALTRLKRLRYLHLARNNISHFPEGLFREFCGTLRGLSAPENGLGSFPRGAIKHCHRLGHLDLGYNRIGDLGPEDFSMWAQELDTLRLNNNQIKDLPAGLFRGCPRLRELSLSFNEVRSVHRDAFRDLGNTLENLEVSFGLKMKSFPAEAIKPLHRLIWLALDNNEIEDLEETALYNQGKDVHVRPLMGAKKKPP